MLTKIVRIMGGDPIKRELQRLSQNVDEINDLEAEYEALSDDALRAKTDEFRQRLAEEETLDDILPEAFATVREASKRTIGLRHYDVQLLGGIVLHQGKIAEMRTGEGKTLVATLPLYLNALTGKGTHLVTVNDYLARRDARWMGPIYNLLGLKVGVLQAADRTENGRNAFLVDLEIRSPHEDQHQLRLVPRREAYLADVTYGTNSEFGFDYLRDNTAMSLDDRVQRGHHYAIVDEVDNILIDEARTPLIISGPASEDTEWYVRMAQVVRVLNPEDYEVSEKDHTVTLTEIGEAHVEQILDTPLRDPERPEDITPEQARLLGFLEQALRAQFLYRRNKDYLVQAGKVIIVDEFTGRLMPGRRWSEGLHQAVEAKEGVKVEAENVTYATITLQNYFRMYTKLAGMTGTALTEAEEFSKIYNLEVVPIPTNLEYVASRSGSPLEEVEARDEDNYKYIYYSHRDDQQRQPVYWKRKDYPDVVYRSGEAKLRAISQEITRYHILGRPVLVGTTSVEHSELLSERLHAEPVRRLMQTLLLHQRWLQKNNREGDERAIPELKPLYKPIDQLNVGEMRQMARSLDMSLNPEDPANLDALLKILDLGEEHRERLVTALQGGVTHQVLNARKHAEESQIIARAGAFGAVTIATNMAGRGVDIKLGGEIPEEIISDVNRILLKAGHEDPYDMTMEERRKALQAVDPEDYGIYEEQAVEYLKAMDDMERVRALGGLHIVGSERHEARRIDNQLRGRAARQGDPGSSRFYLSLEDDLMRMFGGAQVEGLLSRLNIDEAMPIESGMVGRLIEQSQTRVEGANFDVRKHLLEYDDVLNTQRIRIYQQRDAAFTKEDLSEDVADMLRSELEQRIPEALKDEEGPWKLLAYLEDVQPTIEYEDVVFPSYTLRLLLDEVEKKVEAAQGSVVERLRASLLELAEEALDAEKAHMLNNARNLIEKSRDNLDTQLDERFDALDTFIDAQRDREEEEQAPRPQELMEEVTGLVRVPIKLSSEQMRQLVEDPAEVNEAIREQVSNVLASLTLTRLVGAFERRLEESIGLRLQDIMGQDWDAITQSLLTAVENVFERRRERYFGAQGQIIRDLDNALARLKADTVTENQLVHYLSLTAQGTRIAFDRKTHRQGWQRTIRLQYMYLAAHLLEGRPDKDVIDAVEEHLESAQMALWQLWGRSELARLQTSEATLSSLAASLQARLKESLSEERFTSLADQPLIEINPDDRAIISEVLGQRVVNEIFRQLLLSVISELWVDYLTRVEALRVSIGLEAYAQRDPLVQYKGRASELFQELIAEIRAGVISRMFTFRPRQVSQAVAEREPAAVPQPTGADAQPVAALPVQAAQPRPQPQPAPGGGKRKRHRH
jgi:preprotein translocase subunit SecA